MRAPRCSSSSAAAAEAMVSACPEALSDGRRYEIVVRRLADGLLPGLDPSPYTGNGIEYAQSRPWSDGDEVRAIDWRLSARIGRLHVKEYEAARRMPLLLVVDTSASMRVSAGSHGKFRLACQLAGGLALAGLGRASPVGLVEAGPGALRLAPTLDRSAILVGLHRLRGAPPGGRADLAAALLAARPLAGGRMLMIVISDLYEEDVVAAVQRQALEHDVVVLQPIDPAERGRLRAGLLDVQEAESATRRPASSWSVWADPLAHGQTLRAAGVDHLPLPCDQPIAATLRRFLRGRGRRSAGGR